MTTLKFLFEITYLKSPKSFIWKRCALRAGHSAAGWRREIAFITFVVYIHHVRCLFSSRCTLYSSLLSSYRYKGTNMGKAQQKRKALKQQQPITQLALPLLKRPLVLHLWHNSLPSFWLCGVGKSTTVAGSIFVAVAACPPPLSRVSPRNRYCWVQVWPFT